MMTMHSDQLERAHYWHNCTIEASTMAGMIHARGMLAFMGLGASRILGQRTDEQIAVPLNLIAQSPSIDTMPIAGASDNIDIDNASSKRAFPSALPVRLRHRGAAGQQHCEHDSSAFHADTQARDGAKSKRYSYYQ